MSIQARNIHDRVDRLRHELDEVQIALDKDPYSVDLREEEAAYLTAFNKAILDEERFLKQKAKIEWLQEGDGPVSDMDTEGLFNKRLIQHKADNMVRGVLDSKIRCAMFLIGNDKAPSPDGFTLIFFKKAWDVVGFEVCNAVRDFFTNGKRIVVDDLIVFSHGDVISAKVIMDSLEEFKGVSGLVPSIPKSTIFLCNVRDHVRTSILQLMPFEEGILPIKYLGVPLISSRLLYKDCKILVEKVHKRIGDWKNKWLSFAGRHQLVISVLSSMHIYWASVFILPMGIINHIEQLMSGFLWCQGDMKRGKAKVLWEDVCLPKQEGGLGIRRLENFNVALMCTHVWKIVTRKESLWVKWIHAYKLKKRSFWDVKMASNMRGGFNMQECVNDIISDGVWAWPSEWHNRYPTLNLINVHILNAQQVDKLQWKAYDGSLKDFLCRENVLNVAGISGVSSQWDDIMLWLLPISKSKTVISIVGRLIVAATSYFLWRERNDRIHGKGDKKVEQVSKYVADSVRLKLASIKFKKNARVRKLMETWKLAFEANEN
ncbi:hypothetical protein Tco_0389901 [Tanacetum coccineum]